MGKTDNTFVLYDDGTRRFTCTFKNCQRGSQNVVYRILTDDGMTYIGNAGLEGILGRLRQYPHECSAVWNRIIKSGHCTITVLGYEFDTKKRYLLENRHIFDAAKARLREKGYNGNYSPSQVNILFPEVSDKILNKRLDRCGDLTYALAHNLL